ncbi:MAG TPA: energy transducer TonB [Candidatus Angelobacter sp.]|nr:energy transducer TonB [Candidatus Angelobacter sp.]
MWRFSVRMLFAMTIIFSVPVRSQTTSLPRFSGRNLRTITETIVVPLYPKDAITNRLTGVAVALVTVTEKGVVSRVEVLEAPSLSIGTSLSDALSQWRFKTAANDGHPTGYTGKVTYYFVFQTGTPAVLSPNEAPYIGRWPAKTRW